LLSTRTIAIPEYQRTYDWNSETFEQLLECLEEHRKIHPSTLQHNPYFLGNLMIHKADDVFWLVDGQQRLVTITIIAAAVRDICIENGRYDLAYEIQDEMIFSKHRDANYLTPRDTKVASKSPKRLLKPLQVPIDSEFEFRFAGNQSSNTDDDFFDLAEPIVIPWPIEQGDKEEIRNRPGVAFTFGKSYSAGEEVGRLLGCLEIIPDDEIAADERLVLRREQRTKVISDELSGNWDRRRKIVGHYENKRFKFKGSKPWIEDKLEGLGREDLENRLKQWKDLVTYLAFTTSEFTREEDAIFYFGKLNDASTSMQLNVGDLMRHHVALCTKQPPLIHTLNDDISRTWDDIEALLKEETEKDHIPSFLYSWLASTGNRQSARNVYTTIKDSLETAEFRPDGQWKKDEYYSWIRMLLATAGQFRYICEPKDGDTYNLSMDSMGRVADQHMPLFLAGLRAFEVHGMGDKMSRLIKIYEYMTVKGVEIPSAVEIGGGVTGPEKYSWIDTWCKLLYDETQEFSQPITEERSDEILDEWAATVKSRCDQIWTGAQKEDGTPVNWSKESMKELQVNQGVAKLILTRIELTKDNTKSWDTSIEVEHVLPQKWTEDWEDGSKGGEFTEEEARQFREYLGNRSLLNSEANGKLSNKSFTEKQTMENYGYDEHHSWHITGNLTSSKISVWNPVELKKRTEELAGEMVEIYCDSFIGL
tara:strand:- start:84 stop:2195 length:2112 start_codon:yes stop_codon:yes gene_type:complete